MCHRITIYIGGALHDPSARIPGKPFTVSRVPAISADLVGGVVALRDRTCHAGGSLDTRLRHDGEA